MPVSCVAQPPFNCLLISGRGPLLAVCARKCTVCKGTCLPVDEAAYLFGLALQGPGTAVQIEALAARRGQLQKSTAVQ